MRILISFQMMVVLASLIIANSAASAFEAPIYPKSKLADLQQRYATGVIGNFRDVAIPLLTKDELAKLKDVKFVFPMAVKGVEPFAYYADRDSKKIAFSINSLKFFDDISVASAWLNRNQYSDQSIINYLLMLRYWKKETPPPLPLDVLCIPKDALSNKDVDSLSLKILNTAIYFVMAHELGHIFHNHSGNQSVSPAESRKAEEEADAFALDLMARTGDYPGGIVLLLTGMAVAYENRSDYKSGKQFLDDIERRTHPLTTERMAKFADILSNTSQIYAKSGTEAYKILNLSLNVLIVVGGLVDADLLLALNGRNLTASDLGPMKIGDKLGRTCGKQFPNIPFSGRFNGKTTVHTVEYISQIEMENTNNLITGKYSYGVGVGQFTGTLVDNKLQLEWKLGEESGHGALTYRDGKYVGSWDTPNSVIDGGIWNITGNTP